MVVAHPQEPVRQVLVSGNPVKNPKFTSTVTNTVLLAVAVPIPETGWVAYANTEYSYVLAGALASLRPGLLALVLSTTASLFLALKLQRDIMKPISALQDFAGEAAAGNLEARVNISGNDELAATGLALDRMAARIKNLETGRRLFIQLSAHELRNPLAGMKGIMQLLQMQLADGLPRKDATEMLAVAQQEVDRMSTILNQLLEAFKAQNWQFDYHEYNWKNLDLTKIVLGVTKVFQLGHSSHQIILDLGNEQLIVRSDQNKLESALRNLLHNAVKYSPGERVVTVSLRSTDNNEALLSVTDTGIGVTADDLENIFEPFFRSISTITRDPGGMGLGLYLSREIILKHKGRIWAESPGQGSIFYIQLPLVKELPD